jgi:hypothetical protein
MPSELNAILSATMWPAMLPMFGEAITHDSPAAAAALATTLVFDDGEVVRQEKGGRVAALISGPAASFAVDPPLERDTYTREAGSVYVCVEVEKDTIGGYKCWCRLQSA